MKNKDIETELVLSDSQKITFCGKTIGWKHNVESDFTKPFEIEAIPGKHDYKTCQHCQNSLTQLMKKFTLKYTGNKTTKGFPYCCSLHENLINYKGFKRNEFDHVPEMAAYKITFTRQHIINNIESKEWYKKITDYIEWAVLSFGSMPKDCGEPFLLSPYIRDIRSYLESNKVFNILRRNQLVKFIDKIDNPENDEKKDLQVLLNTYESWIKIFPFGLNSYFGNLEKHYLSTLPLLVSKPQTNIYSGLSKTNYHTKESLIEALINITESLLTQINSLDLYEHGLLNDTTKIKLELLLNERKLRLKEGYKNDSPNEEHRYIKIIKQWFSDEKAFVNELTPLLLLSDNKMEIDAVDSEIEVIKNRFDSISISEIFLHFNKGLVEKNYISKPELILFIILAFEKMEIPKTKFKIQNLQTKRKVVKVFYDYYKNIAGKPHRKQRQYASLLCNYFEGFDINNVSTNFNK